MTLNCPADELFGTDTICRASANAACDVAESCTGTSVTCPADVFAPDDTQCGSAGSVCRSGDCVLVTPPSRYSYSCSCSSADAGLGAFAVLALALSRRRRRRAAAAACASAGGLAAVAVLCALLLAGSASAADKRKLVFMGVRAGVGVSIGDAKTLSGVIQSELSALGPYDVMSESDLQMLLGNERQKQLMGCSEEESAACMEELAGALNADRVIISDVACISDRLVFNLSLLDGRKNTVVARVGKTLDSCADLGPLVDVAKASVYELANQAPEQAGKPLAPEIEFGGFTVGVGAEGEVLGKVVMPIVTAEYSRKYLGVAATFIATPNPGARLEGRFYPFTAGRFRPYVAIGGTGLATGFGLHGGLGLAVRVWRLQILAEGAYERFFPASRYANDAVIVGLKVAYKF